MQQKFAGATVTRVIDPSRTRVPEHAHDWPVLSLFVIGSYANETEIGEEFISGPSAVLYRAGAVHYNAVGAVGFEQIEIEFDPAWLGSAWLPAAPVSRWIGGRAGAEAKAVAQLCGRVVAEDRLRAVLRRFLDIASCECAPHRPGWTGTIVQRLGENTNVRVRDLAREIGLHPAWLGTGYRNATGEAVLETAARFRVEHAARLLRETDEPPASIAADAGFCDQSHMVRTFKRIVGRVPSAVRDDRFAFRQIAATRVLTA